MLKKGIGLSLATTLLSLGVGHITSFAAVNQDQTHTTSVGQVEGAISCKPIVLLQSQKVFKNGNQFQIANPTASGQGQVGTSTVSQVQAANTSGPATLSQSSWMNVGLFEKQSENSKGQQQYTGVSDNLNQTTSTSGPGQTIQAQVGVASSIQFQASITGGPTMQNQITYHNVIQYQASMDKPVK
jgi:hypothetical protein